MSVIYLAEIKQLVELQKVDDERFLTRQILEEAPEEIAKLTRNFEAVERRRNHILDKISHLKDQEKRLSGEMQDDQAKIKKSRSKLDQVENSREYQAVLREIDTMEKSNSNREEDRSALTDELNTQNAALDEITTEYEALKSELEERRQSLDAILAETNTKLEALDAKRAEASERISKPVFQRYEFIRKRLDHPVIVAVEDGICSGCNIAVPPQTFIELQRGQQIMSCPNCQRLIFWNKHFEEEEKPETAKAPELPLENQEEEESSEALSKNRGRGRRKTRESEAHDQIIAITEEILEDPQSEEPVQADLVVEDESQSGQMQAEDVVIKKPRSRSKKKESSENQNEAQDSSENDTLEEAPATKSRARSKKKESSENQNDTQDSSENEALEEASVTKSRARSKKDTSEALEDGEVKPAKKSRSKKTASETNETARDKERSEEA